MPNLETAVILKSLKDGGLTNQEIIQLVKADGWNAVKRLV